MTNRLLSYRDLKNEFGLERKRVWALVRKGRFPASVEIADRLSGRKLSDYRRTKALKRGGRTRGKFKGKRCYWRGNLQPDYFDEDLKNEL